MKRILLILAIIPGSILSLYSAPQDDPGQSITVTVLDQRASPYSKTVPGFFNFATYGGASWVSISRKEVKIDTAAFLMSQRMFLKNDVSLDPSLSIQIFAELNGHLYYAPTGSCGKSIMRDGVVLTIQTQGEGTKEMTLQIFALWVLNGVPTSATPISLGRYQFKINPRDEQQTP